MKPTNRKDSPATCRTPLTAKRLLTGILLALSAGLTAPAQQTVFNDTFGTSSLDQTNIAVGIPGGIPTTSQTSYTVVSAKNALASNIAANHLQIITASTSSGNTEVQAQFTKYPVTLASIGDFVELTYTFTDLAPILQSSEANNQDALFVGIFNSGGVAPQSGTVLANGGFSSSLTSEDTGGTINWVGYSAQMYGSTSGWRLYSRPVQTAQNNMNQGLLYNYTQAGANGGSIVPLSPDLTSGQQYTVQLRVTLSAAGQLTVSNAFYTGTSTAGAQFTNTSWTVTGANVLSTNFDSLAIGYRAADSKIWTNDVNNITVVASLAAQAGPYFFVTSTGSGCGGNTVGLSGSVTTNAYLLYTNGVYNGQSISGTGSAISFGFEANPAVYTVVASNTVTTSTGPMYGSSLVSSGPPSFILEPAAVSCVTNVTANFTVAAAGVSLTYQWYKNSVILTNGAEVSGALSTNLVLAPTQASDVGSYYVVIHDACGDELTSTPVTLTLTPARNLVWAGGNADDNWEFSELNFTLNGTPTTFDNGDLVTFNDSSDNNDVTLTNSVVSTLVTVDSANGYTFNGTGAIAGFSQLVDTGSGTLAIYNNNTYAGGTVISNGATLQLGDASSTANNGSLAGTVTIASGGTLSYDFAGSGNSSVNLNHVLAGNGTVSVNTENGSTIATLLTGVSSNFTGTIDIAANTVLHASDGNAGYALGNGSTVNVPDGAQAWLDRSSTAYNNMFIIGGAGWLGANPQTGALRIFGNTLNGPITLTDNARIGGTINGGTIQGVISGPYQLEVWGTTNSYVLVLGPTNGAPQGYVATLITAGSIQAANSNAISTGPLTLDSGGDLRLYGNNITVSNLSSVDSGNILEIEGPRVRNMHASTNAVLTVGTDGTSTEFDGTFSDGAAGTLGLTKVGAGTLTLTGVNTNSGPVIVSGGSLLLNDPGSFAKAALISARSGATFDVTGRGDQTLTLNSGQTLTGSGTVNGNLTTLAGSTLNPGDTIGTLNISENATLAGVLLLELNRTNTPASNDSLAVTGTLTVGGTLTVTNLGPALHAGDAFHLFATGESGFAAVNLQTNDLANNVVYTWNNTITANGTITVASVRSLVNTNAPKIQVSITGNTLNLGWPTNAGWTLLTNSVGLAATSQWYPYPNSASLTNVSIQTSPAKTNVFFRLVYPYP